MLAVKWYHALAAGSLQSILHVTFERSILGIPDLTSGILEAACRQWDFHEELEQGKQGLYGPASAM
jgi:hypothetical protein